MALDFPSNPVNGQVFGSYVWSSSKGVWQSREESAAPAVVSPVPPTTPTTGDIWVDSSDGISYVYYNDGSSGQWIEMISSGVPQLASKANLSGGNTFIGTQTLNTPLAITSGGTGANSLSGAQSNLQIQLSPNYVINGAFDIFQRSVGPVSGPGYVSADRWRLFNNLVGTMTSARETSIVPDGFNNSFRITQTGTTSEVYAFQSIETSNAKLLAGKVVTLSAYVYGTVSTSFTVGLQFDPAIDRTPVTGYASGTTSVTQSVGSSWTRISVTGTVPLNTNTIRVDLRAINPTLGQPFYFAGVQLEEGSFATTFRRNTNSIQGELAACQRYFVRLSSDGSSTNFNFYGTGSMYQPTLGLVTISYPVTMRRRPTVTTSAANTFQILTASSNIVCSAITATDTNQSPQVASLDITSSSTIGNSAGFTFRSNGATSWIHADAEL